MSDVTIPIFAVSFAVIYGLFVAASIILTFRLGRSRSVMGWLGLGGGLTIALGFAIFRAHLAVDRRDLLIALGLATVEVGAIICLEWIGSHLRRIYAEWVARKAEYDETAGLLTAAQEEQHHRKVLLDETRSETQAHIQYVEERLLRRVRAPELEDAGVRAAREGYLAGIDANRQEVQSA